jgi:ATP-dependent DNA helicase RecG
MTMDKDNLPREIQQKITNGKSALFDWFKDNTPTNKIAATLAAMANSMGGIVCVGVGPTGIIEGVREPATTTDTILEAAISLEPSLIIPLPRTVIVADKTIITVYVPPGMPNVYGQNGHFMRREDTRNVGLKPTTLRRLMIERGVTSFEMEIVPGTDLEDINWDRAKTYARSLSGMGEQDVEKILERRGCLVNFNGKLRPTNAGILLFGEDPQRHIRGSEITAARFAGDRMGDVFNREDITGTLPEQIRRAETFLKDHIRKGIVLSGDMERKEQLEYPMEAARELVVNAVAHRDYSITGDGVRLFLFRDHMEVSSPGGLAGHVTVDNIKDERFSRNPVIVQVLADMGFIERLGYGVDRVLDLAEAENLRKPEFRETDGGFRVTLFRAAVPIAFAPVEAPLTDPLEGIEEPLNPRQEIAVKHLRMAHNNRITNSNLQELCPGVHAETIRRDLADLVTKNILVKKGQKRGSYYVLHTTYQVGRDMQL